MPTYERAVMLPGAARFRPDWVPWLGYPAGLAIISFTIYPFITTVYVSFTAFHDKGESARFVGIDNYAAILGTQSFWEALRNSSSTAVCRARSWCSLPAAGPPGEVACPHRLLRAALPARDLYVPDQPAGFLGLRSRSCRINKHPSYDHRLMVDLPYHDPVFVGPWRTWTSLYEAAEIDGAGPSAVL